MAEGRSNSGIAAELVVTVPAVERHVTGIFDKLGLRQAPEDHRRVLAVLRVPQASGVTYRIVRGAVIAAGSVRRRRTARSPR